MLNQLTFYFNHIQHTFRERTRCHYNSIFNESSTLTPVKDVKGCYIILVFKRNECIVYDTLGILSVIFYRCNNTCECAVLCASFLTIIAPSNVKQRFTNLKLKLVQLNVLLTWFWIFPLHLDLPFIRDIAVITIYLNDFVLCN